MDTSTPCIRNGTHKEHCSGDRKVRCWHCVEISALPKGVYLLSWGCEKLSQSRSWETRGSRTIGITVEPVHTCDSAEGRSAGMALDVPSNSMI